MPARCIGTGYLSRKVSLHYYSDVDLTVDFRIRKLDRKRVDLFGMFLSGFFPISLKIYKGKKGNTQVFFWTDLK